LKPKRWNRRKKWVDDTNFATWTRISFKTKDFCNRWWVGKKRGQAQVGFSGSAPRGRKGHPRLRVKIFSSAQLARKSDFKNLKDSKASASRGNSPLTRGNPRGPERQNASSVRGNYVLTIPKEKNNECRRGRRILKRDQGGDSRISPDYYRGLSFARGE